MANGGRIDYTIGFKVDDGGIAKLKNQLKEIQTLSATQIRDMNPGMSIDQARSSLMKVREAASQVQQAMTNAFDTKTGVMNLQALQNNLKTLDLKKVQAGFNSIGQQGSKAFLDISKAALTTNVNLKQTNTFIDKMGQTLINTLKWTVSSSLINRFIGAFQQAFGYAQHLDSSLNDIRIVTGKSADEMNKFAEKANKAAQNLGKSTTEYTEASLIYYQQGLSDEETAARTETTLKAANVTGQSAQAVSEQLTAVWNGYKVSAENTEESVDKLAAVAATTAADLEELSIGMSKVASAANSMGVDMDQLNATIATIESVTRQAPESVGTALKTIYARMGDLKLGDTDEDGLKLGDVSSTLQKVGIDILDVNGELRDMGVIIEEIGDKWGTWTKAQQTAIAESVAGKRQYNNLFALFNNWDMYNKALETSRNSIGTLQQQQDIHMESTAAHIQQLKTQWEDLYDSLLDADSINTVTDGLTNILKLITNILDSIGGGKNLLVGIVGLVGTLFGKQLGQSIGDFAKGITDVRKNAAILEQTLANIRVQEREGILGGNAAKRMTELNSKMSQYWHLMSAEEFNAHQETIRQIGDWEDLKEIIQKDTDALKQYFQTYGNKNEQKVVSKDSNDFLNEGSTDQKTLQTGLNDRIKKVQALRDVYADINKAIDQYNQKYTKFDNTDTSKVKQESKRLELLQAMENKTKDLSTAVKELNRLGLLDDKKLKQSEKIIQQIKQRIESIKNNPKSGKGDFAKTLRDEIGKLGETIKLTDEQVQYLKKSLETAGANTKDAEIAIQGLIGSLGEENLAIRQTAEAWSNLAGGLSSIVFGFQSVYSALDSIANTDLSFGQHLLQLISGLSFGLPMLLNGLRNFNTAIGTLTASTIFLSKAERDKQIVDLADNANILQKTAAYLGLNATMGVTLAIIGGVVAAIGIVTVGYKIYTKHLKDNAEKAEENAQAQQKIIDKTKEEKQTIDDLANSYENLLKQRDENNKFSKEQEKQVYDLVKAYGDHDMIIQALAKDYDGLERSIKKAQNTANEELIDELKEGQTDYQASLKNNIIANASMTERDAAGYDLSGLGGLDTEKDFRNDIAALIGKEGQDIIDSSGHINYDDLIKVLTADTKKLQDFLDKYQKLDAADQIRKLLRDNESTIAALKDTETKLNDSILNRLGFQYTDNLEAITSLNQYEEIIQKMANNAVSSGMVETEEEGKEWARHFASGISEELALNESKSILIDSILNDIELSDEKKKEVAKDLINSLNSLTDAQIAGVASNQNLFRVFLNDGKDVDEIIKHLSAEFDILENEDHIVKIDAVLEKDFDDETIQELFADETIDIGVSQEQFNLLDESSKYALLAKYRQDELDQINQLTDAQKQEAQVRVDTLEADIKAEQQLIEETKKRKELEESKIEDFDNPVYHDNFSDTDVTFNDIAQNMQEEGEELSTDDLNDLQNRYADIMDQFSEIYYNIEEVGGDVHSALAAAQDDIFKGNEDVLAFMEEMATRIAQNEGAGRSTNEVFEELITTWAEDKKALRNFDKELQKHEDNIAKDNAELTKLGETQIDYAKQVALWQKSIKSLNSNIDNLQSAYQSLQSIVSDYNEDGLLTLDNVQQLIEMEDAYVAALDIENGQMSINDESMQSMLNTKIELLKVEATEEYLAKLRQIANQQDIQGNEALVLSELAAQEAIQGTTAAAKEGVNALLDLADAKAAAAVDKAATEEATKAYYNRMQMLDQLGQQSTSQLLGSKSAGGSSSGSEKAKEADHEEYLEREEDIYRTINEELEQIESTLGRIQTINDHEWGIDAQKTLEEENKLLDEQLKKLEEKRDLQLGDLETRRKQLEDIGVQFSDDGSAMLNAEGQLNKLYAQYNSMVDHYNSLSADAQEVYKAELEAEKEKIDTIEKKMDEYESGFSDYQSTLDEILDTHYAAIENEVNQFNNMVDVHLELKDAEKEWNDFWKEVVEDVQETDFAGQIAASLKQLNTLVGTPFANADSTVTTLTKHLNETVAEVQAQIASANRGGEDSLFGDDTLASKENLEKYRDSLMEALRSAKGEVDNISENYLKMLDDAQKQIDEQVEGWNSIGDQIEHDVELIKLISGDKAFEALNKQYDKQYENDLKLINTQKQSQDFWKQQIERYQKLVNTTDKTTVEWRTYNDSLKKSVENYRKATADLDKTVQKSIKDLQTWRENNVKAITDTLDKAMSGGLGLNNIEQEWKLINDYADQYYDNVERAFNMEDYTNILDDAANAIGLSAENQAKLNNFRQQELAQLNAKNKLTQYDIDESKARLEILKAEIALQDTQRNKSNMRLRRDNQGNYVYQYTGDEAEQDKAENGLLTARREWYELVKKRNKETNDYIIQLGKERIDLQTQLAEAQLQGDTERINLLLRLIKENEQQQVFAYEQAENAKRNLIEGTAQFFADVENHDVLPMWNTTINQLVDKWARSEDSFIQASIKAIKDLQGVQDEYNIRTKEVLEEAGINYLKLKEDGIDPTKDSLDELTGSNEDLADALDNVNSLLSEQETNLRNAETAYLNLKDAAVGAIMAANQALVQLSQTAIQTVQQVQAAVAAAQSAQSILNSRLNSGVNNYSGGGNGNNRTLSPQNPIGLNKSYIVYTDPNGAYGKYAVSVNGKKVFIGDSEQSVRKWLSANGYDPNGGNWQTNAGGGNWTTRGNSYKQSSTTSSSSGPAYNQGISGNNNLDEIEDKLNKWARKLIRGYDTGGYTGAWGKNGKLAILHEKELVLNKDDTTNILKAVEMMRQVAQLSGIGNNLLNASMTSSNMLAKLNAGILQGTNNFNTNTNSNKNMSMVINADFSGVRSADEIYQALIELQNYGLQENYSVAPHINIGY